MTHGSDSDSDKKGKLSKKANHMTLKPRTRNNCFVYFDTSSAARKVKNATKNRGYGQTPKFKAIFLSKKCTVF